ncbi:glycoside hydrolase family 38 C-terminal domain-containing protein [Pedobacter fastidiosus]|uniref:Glycosyl hydrolase n=1 Tax=Pedobacter fastidiosus TaxID=2765361 RepID=A0ABR7KSG2_9SPHI|nr:glycoside hydrolase family 38 C-terminal domain-containing protein [Pedobacter fastidiosus]MBC6110765.1 glycosyl hydrolase [Pedobacter fastidiosus]
MNRSFLLSILSLFLFHPSVAQRSFFIDGYHGGIWGHYPNQYTGFIVEKLDQNPLWKINLEIEPVTWDFVQENDSQNYLHFKQIVENQSVSGKVEFVNPSYGQSYLFNLQGESVIRQFEYGIKKIKSHFPTAEFHTYSSEEPCFTSALPQILTSFGYSYASLKNPNTCWGGYTRAFGGELINWIGSDGSTLLTVPRYATEDLQPKSTWQTTAWNNSKAYKESAFKYGILNPIGMCLQDAGWKNGPWLGEPKNFSYTTWRNYFQNIADKKSIKTWKLNQEDLQVSLVWGAQILQKLAQETRRAENKIIMSEKIDAINSISNASTFNVGKFDSAWENLLLAQHHDSWIVPYNIVNKEKNWNWAQQVSYWAKNSNQICDSIVLKSIDQKSDNGLNFRVYNTQAYPRNEVIRINFPNNLENPQVFNSSGEFIKSQIIFKTDTSERKILFLASTPAMGFSTFKIKEAKIKVHQPYSSMATLIDDKCVINTNQYKIIFNASKGGIIEQLIAKKIDQKDFVALKGKRYFNEMRGFFYKKNMYVSSADNPAKITIIENGPIEVKLKIEGKISIHNFVQFITLTQNSAVIDVKTDVNWVGNPGIGQGYAQEKGWKADDYKKAFYNDSLKFLAVFPLAVSNQKVFKNSAFDVMKSGLSNTFFNTWDSIKNNLIVNWVDVVDNSGKYGITLLNDHTTSYTHDEKGVLGLTLQYSGMGLWGINYKIEGASKYNYALIPHRNNWAGANTWTQSINWNEPLQVFQVSSKSKTEETLFQLSRTGYEISSVTTEKKTMLIRIFNANDDLGKIALNLNVPINKAELVELNHKKKADLTLISQRNGKKVILLSIPKFGFRTIKLYF